jgi:hypothetical protein
MKKIHYSQLRDRFDAIDESKAPNVKQFLRGVKNYYILSQNLKVSEN